MNFSEKRNLSLMLGALSILVIRLIWLYFGTDIDFSKNSIDLVSAGVEVVRVPILDYKVDKDFNKQTLSEIRLDSVKKVPELAPANYATMPELSQMVNEDTPWQSRISYYFYGDSPDLHLGPPAQSVGIFNPYLLIYPDFTGLSIRSNLKWKVDPQIKVLAESGNLPLSPTPESLEWDLSKSKVNVRYNISQYLLSISPYVSSAVKKSDIALEMLSFNAVDFGYVWGMLDPLKSERFSGSHDVSVLYSGFAFVKGGCGLASGCNQTISLSNLGRMTLNSLPAKATFNLWKSKPVSPTTEPELVYNIYFD